MCRSARPVAARRAIGSLLHPELVRSATRDESQASMQTADAYISSNRTCEMGLRQATGRPYQSFIYLLEALSRPDTAPKA